MTRPSLRAKRGNPPLVHSPCKRGSFYKSFKIPAFAGKTLFWIAASLTLLAMTSTARADKKSYEYSPAPCEFTVSFPEEPQPIQKCDTGGKRCYDQLSYTQVFELSATVNFRVICNPADKATIDYYTPAVMQRTLEAMTKRATVAVSDFETSAREAETYRQAGLVGESKIAGEPTIYLAQLWVGKKSIFSVEGELIGESYKEAEELFRDILRSVSFKDVSSE